MLAILPTVVFVVLASICTTGESTCRLEKHQYFLDCRFGNLSSVPSGKLSDELRGIDLSDNSIVEIKNWTFAAVPELQTLDLSSNKLEKLWPEAFLGLGNLLTLNLSNNPLLLSVLDLTAELFRPLVSLKVIRVQRFALFPQWKGIDNSFGKLKNLTTLFLDIPDKFVFQNGWGTLSNLSRISTSEEETNMFSYRFDRYCQWNEIKKDAFEVFRTVAVRELQLVSCKIKSISTGAFEPLGLLETLDLSLNFQLGLRRALLSLRGLEQVNMTAIKLSMVNGDDVRRDYMLKVGDFKYMREICVRSVDLSQNSIFYEYRQPNPIEFRLDCLESLNMSFHAFDFTPKQLMWSFRDSLSLKVLDFRRLRGRPSIALDASQTVPSTPTLPYITLPPNLSWFTVTACDDWFPPPVQLNFRFSQSLRYLGAAYINLKECWFAPASGFSNRLTHLDISGSKCRKVSPVYFENLERIITLKLSDCPYMEGVLRLQPSPFDFLPALEHLDLSVNKLTDLNPNLFRKNLHLREITLANNKLQRLPKALSHLSRLQKLDLTFNAVTDFRIEEMRHLEIWMSMATDGHTFQLLLTGNPLQCTCYTVLFIRWLYRQNVYLDNVDQYECLLSNGTWVSLKTFKRHIMDFEIKCVSHTYLIISVVGILTALLLILLFTAMYRYRLNLRYWLYTKLMPPENMFVDHEYNYDAFVAYTSDEYEWIIRQLRPKLELVEDPVRLCIHDRDFIPGKPIHENIVDKMKESRKILLIISPGFLDSRFGPLEIEYAGMKCLEEGRDDIILCVLMEDIPVRQMPRALRNLWHKITFLKWSPNPEEQIIFWRNLKVAVSQRGQ